MKPILYYDDRSPTVRSVLMLIKMLNIDIELKFVDLFKSEQLKPEFKELNPAHTVPVLIDDDDLILTDSHVILIHLCEKYQGNSVQLWPKDYKERMHVLNLLLFESSVIFRRDGDMMLNPAHTVPVLIDDDDIVLTDSHVILIHLCEKYQGDSVQLWPKDYNKRMNVLNLLLFESSVVFRRDSDMMSEIVRKTFAHIDLTYHQRKIHEVFGMIEKYLSKHKYIATDNLTIADLSAVTTLSTVDLMFPIDAEPQQWPLLSLWLKHMKSLAEYQMNLKGLQALRTIVEKRGYFKFPTDVAYKDDEISQ